MSTQDDPADWTVDPETGRSNSSPLFRELVQEVARLMSGGAGHVLDRRWIAGQAQLIMAQLAHVHRLAPEPVTVTQEGPTREAQT